MEDVVVCYGGVDEDEVYGVVIIALLKGWWRLLSGLTEPLLVPRFHL